MCTPQCSSRLLPDLSCPAGLQAGEYIYRLSAWNAYGWSQYASSGSCFTQARGLPCQARRPGGASSQRIPNWLLSVVQALGLAVLISTGMMQAARRSKAVRKTIFRVSRCWIDVMWPSWESCASTARAAARAPEAALPDCQWALIAECGTGTAAARAELTEEESGHHLPGTSMPSAGHCMLLMGSGCWAHHDLPGVHGRCWAMRAPYASGLAM